MVTLTLPEKLRQVERKLQDWLTEQIELLNDRDIQLIERTMHVAMFSADIIEDRCNTDREEGLRKHYLDAFASSMESLETESEAAISMIDVLECHQLCWGLVDDFYRGVTYKKPAFKQLWELCVNRKPEVGEEP